MLGFNGELADSVTGHYLLGNGYRAFNPVLLRFNSPDYLSPFGKGGLNSYAYCLGDPRNLKDPSGHSPLAIWREITRHLIAESKAARLIAERPNLSKLIILKHKESFKQLYYATEEIYNPKIKPQKLKTLALKEFQELPEHARAVAIEKINPAPKLINAPSIARAKKDLADLNRAALRDESGAITGFDMRYLRRTYLNAMQKHPDVALAQKLSLNLSNAILELRSR